jgi:hypothetical protein
MMRKCSFVVVAIAVLTTGTGAVSADPLRSPNIKAIAKVKAEASACSQQRLIREAAETIRACYDAREKNLLRGTGTLVVLLDVSRWLLQAERAQAATDADRMASLERYWQRSRMVEGIVETLYLNGRISSKDYHITRFYRLGGQIALHKLLTSRHQPLVGGRTPDDALRAKDYARAKFDATQADLAQMTKDQLDAIAECVVPRLKNFVAGITTLDILLSESKQWLEASLELNGGPADRLAAYERHWERTKFVEDLTKVRWKQFRVPLQDYESTRCARLGAEQEWHHARSVHPNIEASGPSSVMQIFGGDWRNMSVAKDLTRAKFHAAQSSASELVPDKLEAARTNYTARAVNYTLGVGSLDLVLKASRLLRDAECESATTQTARRLALEKHWERTIAIESINRKRYESGRNPIEDHLECVYERLRAQLALKRFIRPVLPPPPAPRNP